MLLLLICLIWLGICALQDWRTRLVSNWLTLPAIGAGAVIFVATFSPLHAAQFASAALFLAIAYRCGWIGGADFKGSLALALASYWLLVAAWTGAWFLRWRLRQSEGHPVTYPAFVGYALGMAAAAWMSVIFPSLANGLPLLEGSSRFSTLFFLSP